MRDAIAAYVGNRIAAKRVAAQFSLRDLAGMADISAAGISLIEVGKVLPPLDTLYRLAFALGCEPLELLPKRHQVVSK
jgi:transcriptional regulator with XRE-family HTH domain